MSLCFISHFNRASIVNAGDERIMTQYGLSPEAMGWIYSSFLLVYTVFMIPGGVLVDRWGPRIALAGMGVGSAIFCAGTGALGLGILSASGVWWGMLAIRSWMGLLSTPLHPGAARAVAGWFPFEQRGMANGLITGASVLAYAVVHSVFGAIIDWIDWPKAFFLAAVVTTVLAVGWFVYARAEVEALPADDGSRPADRGASETDSGSRLTPVPERTSWSELFTNRSLILLTLGYSAVGYFQYLFFYWLRYYFKDVLKMDPVDTRFYAGLPNLAMAVGMPVGGLLVGYLSQRLRWFRSMYWVPFLGMAGSAVLLLCGIFTQDRGWIVFWFTASLGCHGLCEASFWTTAVRVGGLRGASAAAMMNTGGNAAGLLAPIITPVIGRYLNWEWGMGFGALVALLGGVCWLGIEKAEKSTALGK